MQRISSVLEACIVCCAMHLYMFFWRFLEQLAHRRCLYRSMTLQLASREKGLSGDSLTFFCFGTGVVAAGAAWRLAAARLALEDHGKGEFDKRNGASFLWGPQKNIGPVQHPPSLQYNTIYYCLLSKTSFLDIFICPTTTLSLEQLFH